MQAKLILLSLFLITSLFKDVAEQSGQVSALQRHDREVLPEITGSGAALFDFDNDGDLDVYLVQGNVARAKYSR